MCVFEATLEIDCDREQLEAIQNMANSREKRLDRSKSIDAADESDRRHRGCAWKAARSQVILNTNGSVRSNQNKSALHHLLPRAYIGRK